MNNIKMNLNWKLCAGFNSLWARTSGMLLGTPQLTVSSINFEFRIWWNCQISEVLCEGVCCGSGNRECFWVTGWASCVGWLQAAGTHNTLMVSGFSLYLMGLNRTTLLYFLIVATYEIILPPSAPWRHTGGIEVSALDGGQWWTSLLGRWRSAC